MREGWDVKKLGEILVKTETVDPTMKPNQKFVYLDVSSVNKETKVIEDATVLLGKDAPSRARKLVRIDDVIFATVRPTHSRVALISKEYDNQVCSTGYFVLRGKEFIDNKYLFYFLLTDEFNGFMEKMQKGASYPAVTNTEVKNVNIRFPKSLPEQKRIVSILDKTFAAIAKAKANAEQNLKNARELFESYLQGVFEDRGEGWAERPLGEIAKVIGGYSFKSSDFLKQGKYQVIRMGNVRPGVIRENERPVFIDELEENIRKRALLLPNDVIITQTGTKKKRDYGFTVVIEKDNYLLNQRISAIRFSDNYLPKYFLYFSWTNLFKDQYFANETGTVGQGNVGIGAITNANIPFPKSKTEQKAIVKKLNTLSTKTKKLESIYQKKLTNLEELKKTILQKAFKGEL
jgi:type I restriction enzyme S subunit